MLLKAIQTEPFYIGLFRQSITVFKPIDEDSG
jgi:hypothetical protein